MYTVYTVRKVLGIIPVTQTKEFHDADDHNANSYAGKTVHEANVKSVKVVGERNDIRMYIDKVRPGETHVVKVD